MKKFLTILVFFAFTAVSFGQGSITGKIVDSETNEELIGATVTVKGTAIGTISDIDGTFELAGVEAGEQTIVISFTGFETIEQKINVSGNTDAGTLKLGFASVGLSEVNVVASVAIDRKTPVAVTTIKGETVEALVGNQEYPEILRKTPSVYVTKTGGGFGDSRINVRGFDQRNTAVMINGIPVNDMENGWVYWSNWAGLADVTSQLQVQRGLGASKLAVPTVGGSINIVTNAADFKKGGKVGISTGNDGFQKYSVVLSSGLGEKGFAATAQFTHTRGDGYVDATTFRAYSYFLSMSKTFNANHTLAFTALGAPQWHHQRTISSFDRVYLQTYRDNGYRFNHVAGTLNGEEFTWRKNFFHKPKAFLNHYWNINDKMDLRTSAYVSFGRGGGTGPRGRLRTPGSIFDSFRGFGEGIHDNNGQVRFDDLVAYNQGKEIDPWGTKETMTEGEFAGQYVVTSNGSGGGSGFVRRASMNYHNWYGLLSTLTAEINSNLTFVGGIDYRYYKGEHFRRLENLLGANAYLSRADDNNPENYITMPSEAEFGNFSDDSYQDGTNVLNYRNDGLVSWIGVFGQLEYSVDKLNVFATLSGSNQGFKRIDYFNYLDNDPERETDWQNFFGGTIKAGANYNLNDKMNIFVNGGLLSRQPIFDNVFLNFRNDVNPDAENQKIQSFEIGYGYRSANFRANVNLYYTDWSNRQFDRSFTAQATNAAGETIEVDALANFSNVGETHTGIEIEATYRPIRQLKINAMASLGNWEYSDDFNTVLTNTDTNDPLIGDTNATLYANGLKVGDAAQTVLSFGLNYEPVYGFNVYADVTYFDNLYADFNLVETQFFSPDGQVAKLPSYSLVDAGVSYTFDFNKTDLTLRFNVNNLLDEIYVAELETNVLDDPSTPENEFFTQNQGWYGFGRTWNLGLKFSF